LRRRPAAARSRPTRLELALDAKQRTEGVVALVRWKQQRCRSPARVCGTGLSLLDVALFSAT
jgi:hypothetical protein